VRIDDLAACLRARLSRREIQVAFETYTEGQ